MLMFRRFRRWLSYRRGFRWIPIKAPPSALEMAKYQKAMFDDVAGNITVYSGDLLDNEHHFGTAAQERLGG